MNIAYLMEDTALSGGIRVQLAQADALIARGHRVRIVTKGLPLTWRPSRAEWVYVDDFNTYDARDDDFIIATFWTTLAAGVRDRAEKALHLCQGYEGSFTAYQPIRGEIEAAYRLPIPKLVVARSLIDICKQFTDDVTYIGQIVDDEFFRTRTPARERTDARAAVRRIAGRSQRGRRRLRRRGACALVPSEVRSGPRLAVGAVARGAVRFASRSFMSR